METINYDKHRIYKPNKNKDGAASAIELRKKEGKNEWHRNIQLFWVIAKQKPELDKDGNAQFDWDNALTMKLGMADIGELLACLNRQKDVAGTDRGMFHQNTKGNSVLLFKYFKPENGQAMYTVKISQQREGKTSETKHSLTLGEAQILRVLLTKAVEVYYGW